MSVYSPNDDYADPRITGLIAHLHQLKRTADRVSLSRAALAELRRGLSGSPRDRLVVGKHVVPFLGEMTQPDEEWFYLTAALFASHPLSAKNVSLGRAFRQIKDDSGSTEKRFLNLLAADPEQLRPLLRQAVSLLAVSRRPVGIDWKMLLEDLLRWDRLELPVQNRWARDFFYKPAVDDEEDDEVAAKGSDTLEGDTDEN